MLAIQMMEVRAERGTQFLDSINPDWCARITKPIKVANTKDCPLAQLYGRYRDALNVLGISHQDALNFGFRIDSSEIGFHAHTAELFYKRLDQAWTAQVALRRRQ